MVKTIKIKDWEIDFVSRWLFGFGVAAQDDFSDTMEYSIFVPFLIIHIHKQY